MNQLCNTIRTHTATDTRGDDTQCCVAAKMNCLLYPAPCRGTHKERLKDLGLFRLQETCLHEDSVAGFICLVVTESKKPDCSEVHAKRSR